MLCYAMLCYAMLCVRAAGSSSLRRCNTARILASWTAPGRIMATYCSVTSHMSSSASAGKPPPNLPDAGRLPPTSPGFERAGWPEWSLRSARCSDAEAPRDETSQRIYTRRARRDWSSGSSRRGGGWGGVVRGWVCCGAGAAGRGAGWWCEDLRAQRGSDRRPAVGDLKESIA